MGGIIVGFSSTADNIGTQADALGQGLISEDGQWLGAIGGTNPGGPENPGEPENPLPPGALRGPEEGEVVITSAADLAKIGKDSNYPLDGKYIQMADIDLSGYANWNPIGWPYDGEGKYLADLSFSGSFDGNGFEIKNLQINRPDTDYQGLFGYTAEGASLANVSLENADVTGKSYTGGLVGANGSNSTIMNCYSTGSVNGSGSAVGGLVGRMYNQSGGKSEIINSYCLSSSLDLVELKDYRTTTGGSASNNVVTNSSELSAANMKKQASFFMLGIKKIISA